MHMLLTHSNVVVNIRLRKNLLTAH